MIIIYVLIINIGHKNKPKEYKLWQLYMSLLFRMKTIKMNTLGVEDNLISILS
jgi:hypothetical protein